ncbi:hypothetical protein CEXT_340111 [Caerostris extrusa]|uniref:Uncharacterized protein n=1 Tax=Caerostris extrusa TaxID=172846 RepID=A0AAV4P889_CAEEX|nr:hypothetical protein CEXT_340111 [Caerostris extrusa]
MDKVLRPFPKTDETHIVGGPYSNRATRLLCSHRPRSMEPKNVNRFTEPILMRLWKESGSLECGQTREWKETISYLFE